ncbi:hypothetical protein KBC03_02110 [Patescibacteria group bacterium]|nr:hypothetical protein [Patescibacteria group bacterium]
MLKKAGYAIVAGVGGMLLMVGSAFAVSTTPGGFGSQNSTYNPDVPGAQAGLQGDSLILTIKNGINWLLGLLGLIALIVLLWGGFQMVTAAGDDGKYKAGFKILKQAGVGLLFIGLAWLFVSLIFFVIQSIAP